MTTARLVASGRFVLAASFALMMTWTTAPTGFASTADGETPAEETVCDEETGALKGLCNAYCEAMDCDGGVPEASQKACDRVEDRFINITGRALTCGGGCVAGPKCGGDCVTSDGTPGRCVSFGPDICFCETRK